MKVLACLDLSMQTKDVLEKAVEFAKWQKADLILLTVAEDFIDFGEGVTLALTDQIKKQAAAGLETAGKTAESLGVKAKTILEYGASPADSILTVAEQQGVDLIITGSRAKTGLDRFLIGSVASKVVAHSKCSVLVVR